METRKNWCFIGVEIMCRWCGTPATHNTPVLKASLRRLGGAPTPRRLACLPRLSVQAVVQRLGSPYRFKNHA
jgi:hypothetical protein